MALVLFLISASASCSRSHNGGLPLANATEVRRRRLPRTPTEKILASAREQTQLTTRYDPAYVVISYPNGDVPIDRGVCTDVVIRALRSAGVDLQKAVHEDMRGHFSSYPHRWGLRAPDSNIDHRRVPNLQTFFQRHGKSLPVTDRPTDYRPGDFVTWKLPMGLDHIGIVSDQPSSAPGRYLIIHNIGNGAEAADVLFSWKITGHYRYFGDTR